MPVQKPPRAAGAGVRFSGKNLGEGKPRRKRPSKKEAAVLSDASLGCLAREIAASSLVLGMYLNISTTHLVNARLRMTENGDSDIALADQLLRHWKAMRATAKEKEKVADLDRALRSIGKEDIADTFMDRHRENLELNSEVLAQ